MANILVEQTSGDTVKTAVIMKILTKYKAQRKKEQTVPVRFRVQIQTTNASFPSR